MLFKCAFVSKILLIGSLPDTMGVVPVPKNEIAIFLHLMPLTITIFYLSSSSVYRLYTRPRGNWPFSGL